MEQISIKSNNTNSKPFLDYLIDQSFQRVNRPFVLLFENNTDRTIHSKHDLPTVEIKHRVMINRQIFFNQS